MGLVVPAGVRRSAEEFGESGATWLRELPDTIRHLEAAWSLRLGPPFEGDAQASWVAPVTLPDGRDAVLKVGIPHREARHEAEALRFFDGRGAVRLLAASEDGFSMLLERCLPGHSLWTLQPREGNAAAAALLPRLWRPPPTDAPFETLADLAEEWRESLPRRPGYERDLVAAAVALAGELAASQPELVVVHGDFHPGNVLAAGREPWLAIDCKPLVGDPAYDLAQFLGNRCERAASGPDPVGAVRWQIDQFAELLGLDRRRVGGWTFVKSLGWDWGQETAALLKEAARV